jgi:DNA polymerase III subunit delta'
MLFKDIPGNPGIKERLINTVNTGRVSHALLFIGPEGNAKLAYALAYAQYLSCTDRQEDDSCGQCPSCKKFEKVVHPDLHFVFPVVSAKNLSKPVSDDYLKSWRTFLNDEVFHSFNKWLSAMGTENKQAGIFAQESSSIIRKLNFKTFESDYKSMIIWLPEKMNITAANKVLKMIEEPPPNTLFILVSEAPEAIINTILSRTQPIKIPRSEPEALQAYFKKKYQLPPEKIDEAVYLSENNGAAAAQMLAADSESDNLLLNNFSKMMRLCYTADVKQLIEWADEMSVFGREQQKYFLNYALRMIRENFVLNLAPNEKNKIVFLTEKENAFSQNFSNFIHQKNIKAIAEEFNNAALHIERNGFDKLIFLDLSLKTAKLLKVKPQ